MLCPPSLTGVRVDHDETKSTKGEKKNLALDGNPLGTDGNLAPTGNWHILTTVVATASYWDGNFLDMKDPASPFG